MAVSEYAFSEKTLINILNAVSEGVFLISLEGTVLEANEVILNFHGVMRNEYVGKPLEYFISPQDRQKFRESIRLALNEKLVRDEIKALRKDRSTFLAGLVLSLLRDDSGKPLGIVGIVQDRTQRIREQQKIEKTTSELTALMQSSTEIIRTTDLHKRLKVTAQAIQGLGWQRVLITLTDDNWETTDIVSVGLTADEEEYLWKHRQSGDVWRERLGSRFNQYKLGEFYYLPWSDPFVRNHFKNGTVDSKLPKREMQDWDPQDLLYAPLRLPEGHIVGRISIDDPVDGRRPTRESLSPLELFVHQAAVAIENAYLIRDLENARNQIKDYANQLEQKVEERTGDLKKSQEKLRSIFDASPDAITVTDLNGKIIECNQAALEIIGCNNREDMISKSIFEFIGKQDHGKVTENLRKILEKHSVKNFECTCLTNDKKEFPGELSTTVAKDALGDSVAFVGILKNISERKRMEKQLLKSERLAAIGELATMVGHDLRNPLTGIVGAAYFLKMKLGSKMSKKELEMLELIEKDIEYSNKIVNDLLDFSRDIRLNKTETAVNSIVKEALSHLQIPKKIRISNQTSKAPAISVDFHQIHRVFENIIKNAFEAMPLGGRLEIKAEKKGDWLNVAFKDTGEGIPKENLSKLGSPLFTTKAKGVGMGLAICRRLIEAHGGTIFIDSEKGVGTCVTVTLPIELSPKKEKKSQTAGGE